MLKRAGRSARLTCLIGAVATAQTLLACLACHGGETAPLALDDKGVNNKIRPELTVQLHEFNYSEGAPNSKAPGLKNGLTGVMQLDCSIPVRDNLLLASVEASSRQSPEDFESDLALRELYFEWRAKLNCRLMGDSSSAILRAGSQIFSWGSGVLYNPTDNLSPWNAVDPFEPRRRGAPAISAMFASGLQTLQMIYITELQPTVVSPVGDRFFIYSPAVAPNPNYPSAGPPVLKLNYTATDESFAPSSGRTEGQYATRYTTSLKGWDIALSYFNGYENIPLFEGVPTGTDMAAGMSDMTVRFIYPREQVYGADISRYFGRLGMHVEGAWFDMEETGHNVGIGDKDYGSVIGGFEYPFNDVIGSQDFSLSVEYAREFGEKRDGLIYINRIYPESILCRLAHMVDYRISGEFRYIYDFETESRYLRMFYDYRHSDHVKISAGIDRFDGPPGCFYGEYRNNDRLFVKYELQF